MSVRGFAACKGSGARCDVVAVTDAVLTRACRPFPVGPIRTLDAVHLATAELPGESPQLIYRPGLTLYRFVSLILT